MEFRKLAKMSDFGDVPEESRAKIDIFDQNEGGLTEVLVEK